MAQPPNLQLRIVGQSQPPQAVGTPGLIWQRRLRPITAAVTVLYGALWSTSVTAGSLLNITVVVVIAYLLTVALTQVDLVIRMRRIDRVSPSPQSLANSNESPGAARPSPIVRRLIVYFGVLALGIAWLILSDHMALAVAIVAILAVGMIRLPNTQTPLWASVFAAFTASVNALLLVAIGFLADGDARLGIVLVAGLPLGLLAAGTSAAYAVIETQRRRTQGVLIIPASRGETFAGQMSAILLGGAYLVCLILVGLGALPFWLLLPVISFPVALKSLSDIAGKNSADAGPVGGLGTRLASSLLAFAGLSAAGILLARLFPL